MRVLYLKEKSRSGDRSYRGGVRRESPSGEVGIYGESRDREIAPTGEVSGESRHWGKLAFMGEIAPTGEVSGESRHWGKWHRGGLWRSSGGSRDQERVAIGGSWHQGEVAIGRSLLQGRCQKREVRESRHWGKLASGGSRDREIAPTGEVSGERSPLGEVGIYGEVAIGRTGDVY